MHPSRHSGLGTGEILGFLIVVAIGIAVAVYLNQKPAVVVKTVIVQPNVPAAPVQNIPPPAPAEPVVVKATPPVEVSLPITTIVVAPTVPPCVAIEKKLRIAQDAAVQTQANIAAAKRAALKELYQSPDYVAAKADTADKKEAKQIVADNLQKDRSSAADTDHDVADMQATSAAWVISAGALTKMENDAIASNDQVNQQVQNLKDIKIQIAALQKQLNDYIAAEIRSVCKHSDCRIDNVSLDANEWMIYVEMTPAERANAGAMADLAMRDIGTILETLTKTPFTWNTARFTVYNKSDQKRQAQFQTTYSHSIISASDFESAHIYNFQFPPLRGTTLKTGQMGTLMDAEIIQIVDDRNVLVHLSDDPNLVWIRGVDTTGMIDSSIIDIDVPLNVTGVTRYGSVDGGSNTVPLLEAGNSKQMGDYFDNPKLIRLATNIWLNPHIDQLQGRPPISDSIIRHPGVQLPQLFNTLAIGGYTRADGSACPITFVHSPHVVEFARPDPPANKTPSLPSPIANHTPENPTGLGF